MAVGLPQPLLGVLVAGAGRIPSLTLDPQQVHLRFPGQLSFLKDPTRGMTFEAVRNAYAASQFEQLKGDSVSVGNLTGLAVWVHFDVTAPESNATPWWLLIAPEHIDRITVYQEAADGHFVIHEGGRNLPFSQRGFPSPGHAFRLGHLEGTRHLFLRMTSDATVKIEPSLWQESSLIRYLSGVNTGLGAYFGLAGLLWVMALTRVWMLRNGWDLAYLGYLTGFEVFHFINSGLLEAWGLSNDLVLRDALLIYGLLRFASFFVSMSAGRVTQLRPYIRPLVRSMVIPGPDGFPRVFIPIRTPVWMTSERSGFVKTPVRP